MNFVLALLLSTQVRADVPNAQRQQELESVLQQFAVDMKSANDKRAIKLLAGLSDKIRDTEFPTVEEFAASKEAEGVQFAFAWLFVHRQQYDAAAKVIVQEFVANKDNRPVSHVEVVGIAVRQTRKL